MEHLWERIYPRRDRYSRLIFVIENTAFANEFAPTEFACRRMRYCPVKSVKP
jgi:hypothetical protein